MSDGLIETPVPTPKNYPLSLETRHDRQLGENGQALLQNQWNLFNDLKGDIHFPNPIAERQNKGLPQLTKGTLVHGTSYDPETIRKIKAVGIISGELAGIPEDTETNYCADFFKIPDNMTVSGYLEWCKEDPVSDSPLKKRKPEFNYLPMQGSLTKGLAFIIDTGDPKLQPLLERDAYDPNMQDSVGKVVTQLPIPLTSPTSERMSAILCGVPSNFIDAVIVGDGLTLEEIQDVRGVMGSSVVLYNTSGKIIFSREESSTKKEREATVEINLENGKTISLPTLEVEKMTLYHGTGRSGITEFRDSKATTIGAGAYFTSEFDPASGYSLVRSAGGQDENYVVYEAEIENMRILDLTDKNTLPIFAQFMRPLINTADAQVDSLPDWPQEYKDSFHKSTARTLERINQHTLRGPKDLLLHFGSVARSALMDKGFDGIKALEGGEGWSDETNIGNHDTFVIFDPKKAKVIRELEIASDLPKS